MMTSKKTVTLLIVLILCLIQLPAQAKSFVWKVSKAGDYFYLGGTIHLLNAEDHPLPSEFQAAYKDSTEIVFETDFNALQQPSLQMQLMTSMLYNNGGQLSDSIRPELYAKLKKFLADRQLAIENVQQFQPWGVALVLTLNEYQRLGMVPEYGVDMVVNRRALTDNKQLSALETPEQQIQFLASMATADPNKAIEYTLRDLEALSSFILPLKKSWREGDINSLTKHSLLIKMEQEFPQIYNTLLTKRNNAWINQLVAMANDNDREFVLVGAMHLVGNNGLLRQLEEKGFTITQL